MHDKLIRGGTVVDGSGRQAFSADIAIDNGRVSAVGNLRSESAREVLDAEGLLVTPGWVDIHTHYDGQVTWDPLLTPSCWHGVTSVVMGNCGVGFAPAAPSRRQWLIGLMEGVEDIPGTALAEGIRWEWESFPEYLDAIERRPLAIDVGAQIAHGAVRAYVMGERGAKNEPATADDIERMAAVVREAVEHGALGFSSSRTLVHIAIDGEPVPGTFAAEDELRAFARVLGELGRGIFEVAPAGVVGEDLSAPEKEMAWMRRVSADTGCPITFLLAQHNSDPRAWRRMLALCDEAASDGARVYPQVFGRPTNILFSFRSVHPFFRHPSFLPLADKSPRDWLPHLRDPAFKMKLLAERDPSSDAFALILANCWENTYELGDPPDYEPSPDQSIAARARRVGREPAELAYDLMLEKDASNFLLFAVVGYPDGNLEAVREMLLHPRAVIGASDGGAHCRAICDAGVPSFMLTHWVRDRQRGDRLPLEWIVKKQTRDTATLYGLLDRGLIAPGYRGDLNLIDAAALSLGQPHLVHDLPAGAPRLVQKAKGYVATLVAGEVIMRDGEETGARPGRLIRGARGSPVAG
jgi:N-acyl-D-aspartate/D-glutamate deacylase